MSEDNLPRYAPSRPLPLYRYVPGRAPHPTRDPEGHSHGRDEPAPPPPDPDDWRASADYLYGIDLFNRAYYWEAHEAWEGLWHAAGRDGMTADFLKALIAFAAAGVKIAEGMPRGAASHGGRAVDLLEPIARERPRFMGLDVADLIERARALEAEPPTAEGAVTPLQPLLPQ